MTTLPNPKNKLQSSIQSINQSNPVLLKERVRIPRTRRAGGAALLWRRFPLDGVDSCRLFFTDDLHDNLSWVPASDKPHTFKSCFTHSSQVFFGRPGPFLPGTGLDLTLFISPLERMTCPNHLSRRSRTRMARSHIPSLACSSSIDGSSDGLTPQIQRIIARSLRHSRWRAAEVMGQVSIWKGILVGMCLTIGCYKTCTGKIRFPIHTMGLVCYEMIMGIIIRGNNDTESCIPSIIRQWMYHSFDIIYTERCSTNMI